MLLDVYWPGRTDELLKRILDHRDDFITGCIRDLRQDLRQGPGDQCDSGLCCNRDINLPSEVLNNFVKADISETDTSIILKCDVPGIKKEDIIISLIDGYIKIEGERKEERIKGSLSERHLGKFQRFFRVPQNIRIENIKAKQVDGVLTITIQKSKIEKQKETLIKIE